MPSLHRRPRNVTPRLLAERLLAAENRPTSETDEARVVAAFDRFCALIRARDAPALAVRDELAIQAGLLPPEAYFLETLQRVANPAQRKRTGAFYTPAPIVEYMLARVAQLVPGGPVRIIDPACGSGLFLLGAGAAFSRRPGVTLHGFDISASAVQVASRLLKDRGLPAAVEHRSALQYDHALATCMTPSQGETLVIVGNPPYANFGRANRNAWIGGLLGDYRRDVHERKFNLSDDFVKFLRWGHHWIDRAGQGMLAMITSRTYLAGLTHRGMRQSLLSSFSNIEIVDLHGDGEHADENVFAIRRGVAIAIFSKQEANPTAGIVTYRSFRGSKAEKLAWLRGSSAAQPNLAETFTPVAPHWCFVPERGITSPQEDYQAWPRLDEIFDQYISGVQTKNDALLVDFDRKVLFARIDAYLADHSELQIEVNEACLQPYVVGPLDQRWIYYDPRLLGRARWSVMRHLLVDLNATINDKEQGALVFMRQSSHALSYDHALAVAGLASDRVFHSRRGAPFVAPFFTTAGGTRTCNLQPAWIAECERRLGTPIAGGRLIAFLYAILWSDNYRRRYLSQLQVNFPRLPYPSQRGSFEQLADLGEQLLQLHLQGPIDSPAVRVAGDPAAELHIARGYPRWQESIVWISPTAGFYLPPTNAAGGGPDVAEFTVGGHVVLDRWLRVRQGRTLTAGDVAHVARLVATATESRAIARLIDAVCGERFADQAVTGEVFIDGNA